MNSGGNRDLMPKILRELEQKGQPPRPAGTRPQNMPRRASPPPQRYPPSRRPGRRERIGRVILGALLIVTAVSVVISARSCTDSGGDPSNADTTSAAVSITAEPAESMIVGSVPPKEEGKLRICIDPGHGYDDVGAEHANLGDQSEEDINLAVALKLVPLLEYEGYDVIMTRDSDIPPDYLRPNENGQYLINPKWRSEFANRNDVDLYVSLHCNSYDDPSVSGVRMYYCSDNPHGSNGLANDLAKAVADQFGISVPEPSGAEYDEAFVVTKLVDAPSVLVEMGFVTNAADARLLLDGDWQTGMAQAMAKGIKEYLG